MKKLLLSLGIAALSLTSCDFEKRCECLETSNGIECYPNMCYQASRYDVVESVYIFNLPLNPEESEENYKYDISWNDVIRFDYFNFVDGLIGKRIITIFKISDTILKVTFDGNVVDNTATFGYLRISPSAFKGISERAIDAFLYAYIAIGDNSQVVDKP